MLWEWFSFSCQLQTNVKVHKQREIQKKTKYKKEKNNSLITIINSKYPLQDNDIPVKNLKIARLL